MTSIQELLAFTLQAGASDLYLSSGAPIMVRMHGDVRRLEAAGVPPDGVPADEVSRMLLSVLPEAARERLAEDLEIDVAVRVGAAGRFRVNVFQHERGLGGVFRTIPVGVPTIESLGLPPIVTELCGRPHGLVLVTGPTGAGKSTTLAAMVDRINHLKAGHVITIEDPIEFVHRPAMCMVHQRELGANTRSFAAALRSALRESPDVILVGEMRDLETIELALTAAETGHLVLATLHTVSAWKTVDRIVSVFPASQQEQIRTQLAGSLEGIVAQILLKRADGLGRVAAHETCVGTAAVRGMIREGKVHQLTSAIQTGSKLGMQTLSASIARLLADGRITRAVAEEAQLGHCGAVDLEARPPLPSAPGGQAFGGGSRRSLIGS